MTAGLGEAGKDHIKGEQNSETVRFSQRDSALSSNPSLALDGQKITEPPELEGTTGTIQSNPWPCRHPNIPTIPRWAPLGVLCTQISPELMMLHLWEENKRDA